MVPIKLRRIRRMWRRIYYVGLEPNFCLHVK